jgi:L-2-hydroxyglutarate oxidase LhgO
MESIECIVVGAGVVGLACARALALDGAEVVVIEAASSIGSETSSRNSEVIHAGLYYPTGSLKARACVEGRRRLYDYCEKMGVAHSRCGKLIVAADDADLARLHGLSAQAQANGVEGMSWLEGAEARRLEPALSCVAALMSAETGVIDSHGYMLALQGELEEAGGMIAFGSRVVGGQVTPDGVVLRVVSDGVETEILARTVVTCAGLHSDRLLSALDGFPKAKTPTLHYAKGNYFAFSGANPFKRLIYPLPDAAGLGVHVTFDLGGQLRFGPDVQWIQTLDYDVDPARADGFYAAVRRYWPGLPDNSIQPGYAGIRPKLGDARAPAADFIVQGPAEHGIAGLVNMIGIESPGLTASLALADLALAVARGREARAA